MTNFLKKRVTYRSQTLIEKNFNEISLSKVIIPWKYNVFTNYPNNLVSSRNFCKSIPFVRNFKVIIRAPEEWLILIR